MKKLQELNRLPWVVGLVSFIGAAGGVTVLILGGWRWLTGLEVVWLSLFGAGMMMLYYGVRPAKKGRDTN
jgi:ABC-type multidrug transport system permease subunit